MKRRFKNLAEIHENGTVIIKYSNLSQQADLMIKLPKKYYSVKHCKKEKKFICNGCKCFGVNKKESFAEYKSKF